VAGTGTHGNAGTGGPATQATLNFPSGAAAAPDGTLYVSESNGFRIRKLTPPMPGYASGETLIPDETGREVYVFDSRGRHLRTVDARTQVVTALFEYDPAGRLRIVKDLLGLETRIERDAAGRPTAIVAPSGERTALALDAAGWLARVENPAQEAVSLTSSGTGLLATLTDPRGGVQRFDYDPDSLLTQAGTLSLARDPLTGFLRTTTLGVVVDSRDYSTFGEPRSYRATVNGTAVYDVSYVRDTLGRITQKTETIEGQTTVWGYSYDPADRLEVVTKDGLEVARYAYDSNGNRLTKVTLDGTETGEYDAQDRLLGYGGATYTYTANGELRTKTDGSGTTAYTYDRVGNLTRVELPDGRQVEYVMDGQNRRIGKKVDGVLVQGWLYRDQLEPVAELDGSGQVVARFVLEPARAGLHLEGRRDLQHRQRPPRQPAASHRHGDRGGRPAARLRRVRPGHARH
jgi:YD repeat-containing protein